MVQEVLLLPLAAMEEVLHEPLELGFRVREVAEELAHGSVEVVALMGLYFQQMVGVHQTSWPAACLHLEQESLAAVEELEDQGSPNCSKPHVPSREVQALHAQISLHLREEGVLGIGVPEAQGVEVAKLAAEGMALGLLTKFD